MGRGIDEKGLLGEDSHDQKIATLLRVTGIIFMVALVGGVVFIGVWLATNQFSLSHKPDQPQGCKEQDSCIFQLVESIPENLTYTPGSAAHPSTYQGIKELLALANDTIEIASYYWTMMGTDLPVQDPSDWQGEDLINTLKFAGKERGIKIRIVQNYPGKGQTVADTEMLAKEAGAEVRSLDFARLLKAGIIHTKMWMIDRKHFYLGSANLDWRSFTQVKEMGATVKQCSCLTADLAKIFDAYWYLATPTSTVPSTWPSSYDTIYNSSNPMPVMFNETTYDTYLSSSPPPICPGGRAQDGATIVNIIDNAKQFIHIAVMDYFPTTQFTHPRRYWPDIDDALRRAAFDRKVEVKLLISNWTHTWKDMYNYLYSLKDLQYSDFGVHVDIQVKMFVVPAFTEAQAKIPYSRVNHNKYMVTDQTAYIGTSNWSGDYFISTAGIGLVVNGNSDNSTDIRQQLADVFQRDWDSRYAYPLGHYNVTLS